MLEFTLINFSFSIKFFSFVKLLFTNFSSGLIMASYLSILEKLD